MSYSELWPHERSRYYERSQSFTMDVPSAVLELSGVEVDASSKPAVFLPVDYPFVGESAVDAVVLVMPLYQKDESITPVAA